MADIMTLGELLIDLTQTNVTDGVRQYAANPGGAPANVAVAAARLGASAGFIGRVGADAFGADLRAALERNGVDTAGLYQTEAAPTTLAVVSVSPDGERGFTFYRTPGADTLLTGRETVGALAALPSMPKVLHFGSLSLTTEPARTATLEAVRYAREQGSLISYDTDYRDSLWPDETTAIRWMREPLALADIVKLSEEELPLLTGLTDLDAGSRTLAELGPKLVLVTLGGNGVFYRYGDRTGQIPGVPVQVADTNGAGDTFLGALLSRLVLRDDGPLAALTVRELEEYLVFANRAAAKTCARSGAIPAMPTLAELTGQDLVERFEFRNIRPEETEQAIAIEQICFPPNEACAPGSMRDRVAAAPELFLVAVDRETGKIAGFLNGLATEETKFRDEFFTDAGLHDPEGTVVLLLGLDVLPAYRGQGLAREIVSQYKARQRKQNRRLLILTCLEAKVDMYRKMGFSDLGLSGSVWGGEQWHEMSLAIGG